MEIRIVEDQPCPKCGARWLSPNCDSGDPLDFPNRTKVCDTQNRWWWKCYNPDCDALYYLPETGEVELTKKEKDLNV